MVKGIRILAFQHLPSIVPFVLSAYSPFSRSFLPLFFFLISVPLGTTPLKSKTGKLKGKSTVVSMSASSRYQPMTRTTKPQAPPASKDVSIEYSIGQYQEGLTVWRFFAVDKFPSDPTHSAAATSTNVNMRKKKAAQNITFVLRAQIVQ